MIIKKLSVLIATVATLACSSSYAALAKHATVYLHNDKSYIGGATGAPDVLWTHGVDGLFTSMQGYAYNHEVNIAYNDGNSWNFEFAAPTYDPVTNTNDGRPLTIGFYDHATRLPFNSPTRPGMTISGNGRGDNISIGWFRVLDINYGADGSVDRFAADFRQFDETNVEAGSSVYGSLRFNSNIAITPVPEASTYAMLLAGLGCLAGLARRSKRRTS